MLSCKEQSQKELMREQISSSLVHLKPQKSVFLTEKAKNSNITQGPSAYMALWNSSVHAVSEAFLLAQGLSYSASGTVYGRTGIDIPFTHF